MSLEKTILDLTAKTPSGGTCWIGDIPFTVWYCSDYWEWVFQGVYYFDPLDLSEAIEAFVPQIVEGPPQAVSLSEMPKARPGLARRKAHRVAAKGRSIGLVRRAPERPAALLTTG
jgi:hypothetical protein